MSGDGRVTEKRQNILAETVTYCYIGENRKTGGTKRIMETMCLKAQEGDEVSLLNFRQHGLRPWGFLIDSTSRTMGGLSAL